MATLTLYNTVVDDNSINSPRSEKKRKPHTVHYRAATDSESQPMQRDTTSLHCTDNETDCTGTHETRRRRQAASPSPLPNNNRDGAAIANNTTGSSNRTDSSPRLTMCEPQVCNFPPKHINSINMNNSDINSQLNNIHDERREGTYSPISATGMSPIVRRPPPPAALMPPSPSPPRSDARLTAQMQIPSTQPYFTGDLMQELQQTRHENIMLHREIETMRASLEEALEKLKMRELECVELNQLVDKMQARLDVAEGLDKRNSPFHENLPVNTKKLPPVTSMMPSQKTKIIKKPFFVGKKYLQAPLNPPKGRSASIVRKREKKIDSSLKKHTSTNIPVTANAPEPADISQRQTDDEYSRLSQELAQAKVVIAEQEAVLDRLGLHFPYPSELVSAAVRIIPKFDSLQGREDRKKPKHHEEKQVGVYGVKCAPSRD
ncbi:hypothetical protein LSM04_004755 [Trypanosoma melophagium]|uniref:uncharacterized protein n=1 Tax=Trypanosoma melophagium TaxID=715481 RepID=UPI00351A9837|nr:hypothetical protein LSM04_004755 [Trypanosoma melophagium]